MSSAPRWYTSLAKIISEHDKSSLFLCATVDASSKPHVRSMIHRGFLTSDARPTLPLLLASTDGRAPKVSQITHSTHVELAWWIDSTKDQFRISGHARIVPSPDLTSSPTFSAEPTPAEYTGILALDAEHFDWEAKRREMFDQVSEHMRASWCRPTPGSVLKGGYEEMNDWPTSVKKPSDARTEEEKRLSAEALRNYALVVIEPVEVDWVQMGIVPNHRTRFTRDGDGWKEDPIVP
ncbi:hypothetical protein OF83DRAFT_1168595 [Amylostereum chailletii]|nr:hypothetical protein OF83DRAFT_1168595 [Amylostereum chailletii]